MAICNNPPLPLQGRTLMNSLREKRGIARNLRRCGHLASFRQKERRQVVGQCVFLGLKVAAIFRTAIGFGVNTQRGTGNGCQSGCAGTSAFISSIC